MIVAQVGLLPVVLMVLCVRVGKECPPQGMGCGVDGSAVHVFTTNASSCRSGNYI